MAVLSTRSRVLELWNWCTKEYSDQGIRLSFPAGTDPTKTYYWRHLEKFAAKLDELRLDEQTTKLFIRCAAKYVKKNGLAHKRLAVLSQDSTFRACLEAMQQESQLVDQRIERIAKEHKFLRSQVGDQQPARVLLNITKCYNIVTWYDTSRLSDLYLAISKPCTSALHILDQLDKPARSILPSESVLVGKRLRLEHDPVLRDALKEIMQNDWRAV